MKRKTIFMAVIIAVMSIYGYAEAVDNSTSPPGKEGSSLPGNTSYFQGTWIGTWPTKSDVTIIIGIKNEKGFYDTKYSWGFGQRRDTKPIPPGSLTAIGREQGDEFIIEWKDKEGTKMDIKLKKYKDNVVKATISQAGPVKAGYRDFLEAYLDRK